jgi:hypothetical protein
MSSSSKKPLTSIVLLFVTGIFIFSVYYLYNAIMAFLNSSTTASFQLIFGFLGFSTSFYTLTQFLRRLTKVPKAPPKISTIIECRKCGIKNVKSFVKGDYIFKTIENCQKCDEPMLITGIYAEEVKKK